MEKIIKNKAFTTIRVDEHSKSQYYRLNVIGQHKGKTYEFRVIFDNTSTDLNESVYVLTDNGWVLLGTAAKINAQSCGSCYVWETERQQPESKRIVNALADYIVDINK